MLFNFNNIVNCSESVFVLNLSRETNDHNRYINFARQILDCNLSNYLDYTTVLYLYKIILHQSPHYLVNKIKFFQSPRSFNIILPVNCKSKPRQASFFIRAVKLWNLLTSEQQSITTFAKFKRTCFAYFSNG